MNLVYLLSVLLKLSNNKHNNKNKSHFHGWKKSKNVPHLLWIIYWLASDRITYKGSPLAGRQGRGQQSAGCPFLGGMLGVSRLSPLASTQRGHLLRSCSPWSSTCSCCSVGVADSEGERWVSLKSGTAFFHWICATPLFSKHQHCATWVQKGVWH